MTHVENGEGGKLGGLPSSTNVLRRRRWCCIFFLLRFVQISFASRVAVAFQANFAGLSSPIELFYFCCSQIERVLSAHPPHPNPFQRPLSKLILMSARLSTLWFSFSAAPVRPWVPFCSLFFREMFFTSFVLVFCVFFPLGLALILASSSTVIVTSLLR